MRYGEPSIGAALDRLRDAGCDAHPRRAALPAVRGQHDRLGRRRRRGAGRRERAAFRVLRVVDTFHDDPGYIARAGRRRERLLDAARPARAPRAVVPRRAAPDARPRRSLSLLLPDDGAPARARARARVDASGRSHSSRASAAAAGSSRTRGRAGRARQAKLRRVDVFAPGFVADCLETLEELAIEGKRTFQAAGGGGLQRHSLPQRASALDRGAGRSRRSRICRAGCSRRPTAAEREIDDAARQGAGRRNLTLVAPPDLALPLAETPAMRLVVSIGFSRTVAARQASAAC